MTCTLHPPLSRETLPASRIAVTVSVTLPVGKSSSKSLGDASPLLMSAAALTNFSKLTYP